MATVQGRHPESRASGRLKRNDCQVMLPKGLCGKPSVGHVPDPRAWDGRFWLCADHWDELHACHETYAVREGGSMLFMKAED
jgi:hypothetical protein